jgi:tRNA dimethylallyltransferase
VALLTGIPISAWHERAARAPQVRARYLVVDPGSVLKEWIACRARGMLDAGWLDEVAALDRRVPEDAPAWKATGYAVIRELVRGRFGRAAALERVVIDTRQYAKRQRTWFRHQLAGADVTLLDPTVSDAVARAAAWWSEDNEERA